MKRPRSASKGDALAYVGSDTSQDGVDPDDLLINLELDTMAVEADEQVGA